MRWVGRGVVGGGKGGGKGVREGVREGVGGGFPSLAVCFLCIMFSHGTHAHVVNSRIRHAGGEKTASH